jgi:hypothetical protein
MDDLEPTDTTEPFVDPDERETDDAPGPAIRRRPFVATAAVGLLEGLTSLCLGRSSQEQGGSTATPTTTATPAPTAAATPTTTPASANDARALAERFAPDLYFDRDERWFPTDPRAFVPDADDPVVDGFTALNEYVAAFDDPDAPPFPTVFYHVVSPADDLSVVQYWFYSVFDQFTTNFHWHDWEVLYVWLDTSGREPTPVLYVGSAHARSMPNNEHLDPPSETVSVIAELGSHSSAIGTNRTRDRFERYPVDDEPADVTNEPVAAVAGGEGLPLAYGLPRGEGLTIPYVVPELDGDLLFDHADLRVTADDFLPASLAVDSLADLQRPPSSFPPRRDGLVFGFAGGDVAYDLVPIDAVTHIEAFTGPQLSFPFAVPGFVEDRIAHHLSAAGFPWSDDADQARFDEPIHDVTDDRHRRELGRRYGFSVPDTGSTVVAGVLAMRPNDDAPANGGVTLASLGTEVVALFESDPVAVPSSRGRVVLVDVDDGEHRLVVNGAGYAPYAQRLDVERGADLVRAGAGGRLALVETADAFKLPVDAAARGGAASVRVRDDFEGTVYDAPPVEEDGRSAIYLHRAGAYVVEVTDAAGNVSVERVRPGPTGEPAPVGRTETGKASVVEFVVSYLRETSREYEAELDRVAETREERLDFAAADEIGQRFERALGAVFEAVAALEEGVPEDADGELRTALGHLDAARTVARNAGDGLPTTLRRFVLRRVQEAGTRIRQAIDLDVANA